MITLKEYTELIEYINKQQTKYDERYIVNISSTYDTKNNIIWSINISFHSGMYASMTRDGIGSKLLENISFSHDDCTLDNIKTWIDNLIKGGLIYD